MSTIYMAVTPHGYELYQHGIKNMRWGFRRFQRKDGTLTKAGLRRKAKIDEKYRKKLEKYGLNQDNDTKSQNESYNSPEKPKTASNVDAKQKKQDIISSGSYKELLNNVELFSNSDLEKTLERFQLIDQIKGRVPKEKPKTPKAEKIISALKTASVVADYGSRIGSSIAKIQTSQTELETARNRKKIELRRDARDQKNFEQKYKQNEYWLKNKQKADSLRNERSAYELENQKRKDDLANKKAEAQLLRDKYKVITDYRTITPAERKRYFNDDSRVGYQPGSNVYQQNQNNNHKKKKNYKR